MSKPSFLFGTMHVKDRRVFSFSDSVMLSLQSCKRFSLEVHPDSLLRRMFATIQNQDTMRNIQKLLNKEEYQKLAKRFKDKNGYEMGKTDPLVLESLMQPDDSKPDDQISFIDGYLYGIARTLNKDIYGLEDATSQFDQYYGAGEELKERLKDLLDDESEAMKDESKEEMIKIYSTGDLDAIYKYIEEHEMVDSLIVQRNRVMLHSMEKDMAGESLFTAVGAAHLPGQDGLISLLRKDGYQVTVVKADFTGVSNNYHVDYLKMDWPVARNPEMGYAVNYPGTPINFAISGVATTIYPDLANNVYYGIYAIPRGTKSTPPIRSEVIGKFLENLSKKPKTTIISKKEFPFNGVNCTEVLVKASTGYIRMRLLLANNLLYAIYVGSKLNQLNKPYTDRFLNSLVITLIPEKTSEPWITYTNKEGAFTIKLPGQPKPLVKETPADIQSTHVTFKINLYLSTDTANSKTFLVRYNDYPAGTFLRDHETLFASLIKQFDDKGKIISEPVKIFKDGFEGRAMKIAFKGGFNSEIQIFVRGNRVYVLLKEITQPDLKDETNDQFFNSFHLIPYAEPNYINYEGGNGNYKLQLVSKPYLYVDSAKDYTSFLKNAVTIYSTNPNSGGVYAFEHSNISPYYRVANADSLYKKLVKQFTLYTDSLVQTDTVVINGVKGIEFITANKTTNQKKRTRIVVNNNDFYCLTGHLDNSELFDKTSDFFYNSLYFAKNVAGKMDLQASKAEKICNDLSVTDTDVCKTALGALSYYKFQKEELRYVYSALQKNYPDDCSASGTRVMLVETLKATDNDSTGSVLIRLYGNLKGKDEIKAAILNDMRTVNIKSGYDDYLRLLLSDPPFKAKDEYQMFSPLLDSVEFTAKNFNLILPLIKYENSRNYILRLANNMLNQKRNPYSKIVNASYLTLMTYAQTDMDKYLLLKDSTQNNYSSLIFSYMQLAGKVKNTLLNDNLTRKYLSKGPNGSYIADAVIVRINNNLPGNQLLINRLLDSLGTRYDIMDALNKQKKINTVPAIYRKQDTFAKLCLYQYLSSDDYGSPRHIVLLGNIIKTGAVYYAFKYSLPERDEKAEYIGLTGPYKLNSTQLNFKHYDAYTNYDPYSKNWRAQAIKMIDPLIEAYKDND